MSPNGAVSGATEIALFDACSFFSTNNFDQWYGFRNLHRKGMHVAASCWGAAGVGTCAMIGGPGSANTTWNEIGDSIC